MATASAVSEAYNTTQERAMTVSDQVNLAAGGKQWLSPPDLRLASAYDLHFDEQSAVAPFPLSLCLEITHRCNFDCSFCFNAWAHEPDADGELPQQDWLAIIDHAVQTGVKGIALTGGEPTLRCDWKAIAEYALEMGVCVALLTNGTCLTPSDMPMLSRLAQVQLSLVSTIPDVFSTLTRTQTQHGIVMEKLKWLSGTGVRLAVHKVLLPESANDLDRHLALMGDLGVAEVAFSLFIPMGRGASRHSGRLGLAEIRRCVDRIGLWSERHPDKSVQFYHPLFSCIVKSRRWRRRFAGRCACGRTFATVDPWGRLRTCGAPFGPPGVLLKDSLLTLWNHPYMERFRNGDFLSERCRKCRHLEDCGSCAGMCLAGVL